MNQYKLSEYERVTTEHESGLRVQHGQISNAARYGSARPPRLYPSKSRVTW
jgi:hypothetical protein